MKLVIINGPNLNLLGVREPELYGNRTFEDYLMVLRDKFPTIDIIYEQSNHEGMLIDHLHRHGFDSDGIIINAGGYSHTSVALADAVAAVKTPVVEVHISNIYGRETFRHHSQLTGKCVGSICGMGLQGYALAVVYFTGALATDK
jgi:3-dehydroquinate dehydratase-2